MQSTQPTDQPKYLAIKNWDTFQSSRTAKPMPWLRDYSDQVADPEYSRLSAYQRCILQECRRLRQRLGSNVPYDPQYIASAASLLPHDRVNLPTAVRLLINRGFLIPTNQQHNNVEEIRGEEKRKREEEKETEKSCRVHFSGKNQTTGPQAPEGLPEVKLPVGWVMRDGVAIQTEAAQ